MVALRLQPDEQAMLAGDLGPGVAMAMRIVVQLASAMGAESLLPIVGAHIDSCLYHGQSGLDFVERLVDGGGAVVVPTTLNVSSLDLLHPELYRGDDATAVAARALMDGYVALGCEPTWTCAPYQRVVRPAEGDHIAWAESNAIVFANSVLGARTHRYGDFIDIAAAITGRVPRAGLHVDENRRATAVVDAEPVADLLRSNNIGYACVGFVIGRACDAEIPAIVGLPDETSEDDLKALGAAGASSGSLAMFHAVGITPEAPTLEAALGGLAPQLTVRVDVPALDAVRRELTTTTSAPLRTVSLGTPHYSIDEIRRVHELLGDRSIHPEVDFYISTGRDILLEANLRGWTRSLEASGVTFVTDTCTYITPVLRNTDGVAMTDSAKWAYYAPANIGVDVLFAGVQDCVESAVEGRTKLAAGWSVDAD